MWLSSNLPFLIISDSLRTLSCIFLRKGQGIVLDRSVFSDCVFANVGRKQGFISAEGKSIVNCMCSNDYCNSCDIQSGYFSFNFVLLYVCIHIGNPVAVVIK